MLAAVSGRLLIRTALALVATLALAASAAHAAARTVPRGFFGVNTSGNIEVAPYGVQNAHWDRLATAGAESVRVLFNWDISAKHKGAPIDWSRNDAIVTYAVKHGMSILPVVEYAPPWAKKYKDQVSSPPKGTGNYTSYLRKLIDRYGAKGKFWLLNPLLPKRPLREWQIWNEPEIAFHWYRRPFTRKWGPADAREYVALLKASYRTIKSADPGAKVVLAALSIDSWRSLDKLYRWGNLGKSFDVAALQGYAGKPEFIPTLLKRFRDVLNSHGATKVPMYLTEITWPAAKGKANPRYTTGYMSGFLTTQSGAAQRLAKAYKILSAKNLRTKYKLQRAYWYIGATSYKGRNEFDYSGLLKFTHSKVTPVPAYTAYQKAARAAEGCSKAANGNCR
jgi:polysaccharide biosynthesis protein PslG